jgi:hypothetical protein
LGKKPGLGAFWIWCGLDDTERQVRLQKVFQMPARFGLKMGQNWTSFLLGLHPVFCSDPEVETIVGVGDLIHTEGQPPCNPCISGVDSQENQ